MKLLDIFKKKKKIKKEVKKVEKKEKKPREKKEEIKVEIPKQKKQIPGFGYRILYSPHVTEKATALTKINKYVFRVFAKTNKTEIKRAVENMYGVDVTAVKIINISPKRRRLGRQMGWKKGYKKAIVEVKEGQKIEILPR